MANAINTTIVILLIFLSSCMEEKKFPYEIIDSAEIGNGNVWYSVYSPDTNWNRMIEFSKILLDGKGKGSAIGFFNPKEMTPKFKTDFSVDPMYGAYIIANFHFDKQTKEYTLEITDNRQVEMKFK